MASCSLGAPGIKLPKLEICRARISNQQQQSCLRMCIGARQLQYSGVSISHKPKKAFSLCCGLSSDMESAVKNVEGSTEPKSSGLTSQLIPNASEIQFLVTEMCNTTSIAEFELKLGGFHLHVRRDLADKSVPAPIPAPAPASVSVNSTAEANKSNGAVSSTSLALSVPDPSSSGIQSFLDRASDEGLIILQSPRVGFFRRSRTIKGKRTPPSCKEKQMVKEGQVLCYIEQLGGELPIESDASGEVVKILREDGEPVGYGDDLIAILPSFPGIKLQ